MSIRDNWEKVFGERDGFWYYTGIVAFFFGVLGLIFSIIVTVHSDDPWWLVILGALFAAIPGAIIGLIVDVFTYFSYNEVASRQHLAEYEEKERRRKERLEYENWVEFQQRTGLEVDIDKKLKEWNENYRKSH